MRGPHSPCAGPPPTSGIRRASTMPFASSIISCTMSPAGLISLVSPALSPAARHISSQSPGDVRRAVSGKGRAHVPGDQAAWGSCGGGVGACETQPAALPARAGQPGLSLAQVGSQFLANYQRLSRRLRHAKPLSDSKQRSHINARVAADAPDFSQRIRASLPMPPPASR